MKKPKAHYYLISGYWKDNETQSFDDYMVKSTMEVCEGEDEDIFYFGLDKDTIESSLNKTDTPFEFVITSYKKA